MSSNSFTYDIFDNFIDGIVIVDRASRILYFNSVLEQQTGQSLKRVQRSKPLFEDVFKVDLKSTISNCTDTVPYQEFAISANSDQSSRVQISMKSISENEILLYVRDVTLEETLQRKYRGELDQKEAVISELKTARDQLKDYSENLEKIVQERTQEVQKLSHTQKALLDSLTQGFFLFRENGICDDVFSKSCLTLLSVEPAGKKVWNTLGLNPTQSKAFEKWMTIVFPEVLPFEDLAPLGVPQLKLDDGRTLSLEYYPMRNSDSKIEALVVVVSDVTSLLSAQNQAVESKAQAQMIIELVKQPDRTSRFFKDIENQWEKIPSALNSQNQNELFRILHTLKACYATFEMRDLTISVHELEESLRPDFKVDWNQLAEKINLLQLSHQNFLKVNSFLETLLDRPQSDSHEEIAQWIQTLPLNFQRDYYRLQSTESFLSLVKPFQDAASQIAGQLSKPQPHLQFIGPDLRVPKNLFSNLVSSLIHAIRNSLDHGIEDEAERLDSAKPVNSNIVFKWSLESSVFKFTVSDDGRGINVSTLRQKLSGSEEPDNELIQHIFDPQLSTKSSVTEFSGRGVGLDSLKSACEELFGKVWAENSPGKGLTIKMEIPVSDELIALNSTSLKKAS